MTYGMLLPLFVAVPMFAAAVSVITRNRWIDRVLLVGIPLSSAICGALLLVEHRSTRVIAEQVGAFAPGLSIPFVSDTLSAMMLVITGFTTSIVGVFLTLTGEDKRRFLPALSLLLIAGVNGALLTGDLFNLFVWIEVMLLPSYALIAITGTWRRLGVGRVFVLVNLVTSTILLVGVGWVYGAAGTVNLAALQGAGSDTATAGALAVVLFALGVKGGFVPVHGWLPRSYPATSAGVMALFAGLHTKVALYAILRIYGVTFGTPQPWLVAVVIVAVVTMLVGALGTFGEKRIRHALSYQMVAGVGHIIIALAVFSEVAAAAGLFYLAHHVITMGSLLLTAGAIEQTYGSGRFGRLSGLMKTDKAVAATFAVGLFALVGLPPTSGLWGKVGLMQASADAGGWEGWALIIAVVLASVVSLMALQRLWGQVFWGPKLKDYLPDDPKQGRGPRSKVTDDVRIPMGLAMPGMILAAVSVAMFVGAGELMPIAQQAARDVTDVSSYVQAVLP